MSAEPRRHLANPAALLEAAFSRIYIEHMAEVPIVNPALAVEAIGFTAHQGHWLGILISPWFMNLVVVPGQEGPWTSVRGEDRHFRRFPSGTYAFLGSEEPEVGEFQTCSLISPMGQFNDQESARQTAQEVLAMLLAPPVPGSVPDIGPPRAVEQRAPATVNAAPLEAPPMSVATLPTGACDQAVLHEAETPPVHPMSKRQFLFGALRRG